jgi:HD-GYP domain-containing protein (c-di-GMP phosphodiesterase class II)
LARRLPGDEFVLLAATGINSRELAPAANEGRLGPGSVAAAGLLSVIPRWPFFPGEAPPSAQVLLAELLDHVREACVAGGGTSGFRAAGLSSTGGVVGPIKSAMESGDGTDSPSLVVPLLAGNGPQDEGEVVGLALLWIASADGTIAGTLRAPLEAAALQAGGWLSDSLRTERLGNSYRNLGEVFANAIDARDVHRSGHSSIVAYYCTLIAQSLGLSDHETELVEFAGMLHGVGKLAVPDSVLFKHEPMTEDEREMIHAATVSGGDWLRSIDGLAEVAQMVRSQNENFDGSGYPDGLKGEEIPLGARILAVATRFAAMTRSRADRRAMSVVSGAFESMASQAGKSLDPAIVSAFLASMGRTLE